MPITEFESLPGHGRLWVFPASRALSDEHAARLLGAVDDFLAQWSAHGAPLQAGRRLVEGRFLLVGVDVDAEAPSGCSIDALVNRLQTLGAEMGITLTDHAPVWYRDSEGIHTVTRGEFRELVREGVVSASTHVFDTSLTRVDQAMGGLEKPASETWHRRAFFKDTSPAESVAAAHEDS